MTVEIKACTTAAEAIDFLNELALRPNNQFYFRGHREDAWVLGSTYSRHRLIPSHMLMTDLEEMIDHFIGSVVSTGKALPFQLDNRRAKLEYARHYGLPSPLIDVSYSPLVAMFFAFNGTRGEASKRSAILAINIEGLADIFARVSTMLPSGIPGPDYMTLRTRFYEQLDFTADYPSNELRFFNFPASWNIRMVRQMGGFIYDTFDYQAMGFNSLEDLISKTVETPGPTTTPTLYKVTVPHTEGQDVFNRLDLAGMTGIRLLDDYEGAVADATNAYNYNRKSGYFWDIGQQNTP